MRGSALETAHSPRGRETRWQHAAPRTVWMCRASGAIRGFMWRL